MALLKCPECGNSVSTLADKCPNCGYPVSEMMVEATPISSIESNEKNTSDVKVLTAVPAHKPISKKIIAVIAGLLVLVLGFGIFTAANRLTPEENLQVQKVYSQIAAIGEVKSNSKTQIEIAEEAFAILSSKCQHHVKNRRELTEARDQYDTIKADAVESSISNIGTVTIGSEKRISSARNQYDNLSETQQKKVNNYSILEKAEEELNTLQIENCISLISDIGTVSLESEKKINHAFSAYDALTDTQKEKVTNYADLEKAEDQFQKLAIDNCITLINQIGQVSIDSSKAIAAAESAYKQISSDKQSNVSNYATLKSARTEYDKLKAAKDEADKKIELQSIIRVTRVSCSRPNSAGGVDVYINFTNKASKTIKYATFTVVPYNAVGDIVSSEIGDKTTANLQATGPYSTGHGLGNNRYWDCIWYNSTITSIKLTNIDIEYTDGTRKTISGNDVNYVRN